MTGLLLWGLSTALAEPPSLIYFVLVDRFANGNSENDDVVDLADPQAFHGGDLGGVVDHLDHLQQLGVDTIWLSPVFEMRTAAFHGHGAFHGYWTWSLDRVEPRFGGDEALVELSAAAAEHDIRIMLDMVYNHVAFDSPLVRARPEWFHHEGSIQDWSDPEERVRGDVHGLPDLAQENAEVYHYLLGRSLYWARKVNPVGFRVDAIRHLPVDFLAQLSADLKEELGGDFWLLGEDFEGDPVSLAAREKQIQFDAMFDFPLRYSMIDVFCGGEEPGRLAVTLSADDAYDNPNTLVTFLDNHDLPRALTECGGDVEAVARALLFQFSARGIPAIAYGTEVPLSGAGEPENRADMVWSSPGALTHQIAQFQQLRHNSDVLRNGDNRPIYLDENTLVYLRTTATEVAVVAVHQGERVTTVPLPDWLGGLEPAREVVLGDAEWGSLLTLSTPGVAVFLFSRLDAVPSVSRELVSVSFEVSASLEPGEQLVIVGSEESLGGWDPARGRPVPDSGHVTISLPRGDVVAWKLVHVNTGGEMLWEQRANRYFLVTPEMQETVRYVFPGE